MAILKINLLPPRIKKARIQRMVIAGAMVVGLLLLAIPIGVWYVRFVTAASLKAQIRSKQAEANEYAEVIKKNNQLKDQEAVLAVKLVVLDKLVVRQSLWIKVLEAVSFSQTRSRDLWLTSLISKQMVGADAGKIEITLVGMAFSAASIDEFMRSLKKSDFNPDVKVPDWIPALIGDQKVVRFVMTFSFRV
jgi:hypothetical protein